MSGSSLCRVANSLHLDTLPDHHVLIFTLAYIAMIPCANLIGFAGQELGRKLPHVAGVLTEITYVSSPPWYKACTNSHTASDP